MNASKTWLIVKPEYLDLANEFFWNTGISITSEGKCHLGASIGYQSFTTEYVKEKVQSWTSSLQALSKIAKAHPHMAYCAFTQGLANKWTYLLRTVSNTSDLLQPLENVSFHHFILALVGKPVNDLECALFALPVHLGGLGVTLGHLLILNLLLQLKLLSHWLTIFSIKRELLTLILLLANIKLRLRLLL